MEKVMRKVILATAAAISLAAGGALYASSAQAAPLFDGLHSAMPASNIENVQYLFMFGGHRYCWYPDGWNGPGWYWCGYRLRRGLGYGGGEGWQGHGAPRGGRQAQTPTVSRGGSPPHVSHGARAPHVGSDSRTPNVSHSTRAPHGGGGVGPKGGGGGGPKGGGGGGPKGGGGGGPKGGGGGQPKSP